MNINVESLKDWIIVFGIQFLIALAVLILGWYAINFLCRFVRSRLKKRDIDPSLSEFILLGIKNLLRVLLIISVMGMLGFENTSFIAVLGALSLAIGLALQGTLQNFAGGVIILFLKPFRTGDVVEINGKIGKVEKISLFYTFLRLPDNRIVLFPNGKISNEQLTNFNAEPLRRVDLSIAIAYGDDVSVARSVILQLCAEDTRILTEPAPFIALGELADNSINITVRLWCDTANYWGVFFDMQEKIYAVFPEKGLNFPFPQLDLHLVNGIEGIGK